VRIAALGQLAGPTFGNGFGALSASGAQNVDAAAGIIDRIFEEVSALIFRIERDGFPSSLVLEATAELRALEGRWSSLSEEIGRLEDADLVRWLEQTARLREDARRMYGSLQQRITAAAPARTAAISLKTIAVVGGVLALVVGGYVWSTRYRRFRYGEGRRYVRVTKQRTRRRA